MIELKGYKVNSLEVENKVKAGVQLKLQNQVKYNVNYLNDGKTCIGLMELRITDADMNPFEMKVEAAAEFAYGEEDEKQDIHIKSFDQLFPFIRQVVNTAASLTGMPGLFIPIMKLNRNTVKVNENEPPEKSPLN